MSPQEQLRPPPRGRNNSNHGLRTEPAPPEPRDSSSSTSSSDSESGPDNPVRPQRRPRIDQTPHRPPNDRPPEIEPEQRELEEELTNKIEETRGLNMEDQPKLIKLNVNRRFKELLNKVN